jgi:hypothetical protein
VSGLVCFGLSWLFGSVRGCGCSGCLDVLAAFTVDRVPVVSVLVSGLPSAYANRLAAPDDGGRAVRRGVADGEGAGLRVVPARPHVDLADALQVIPGPDGSREVSDRMAESTPASASSS